MVKRGIKELAIYQIEEDKNEIPIECLRNLYLEKTSEIIYVTRDKKLDGIVCMGEVLYDHKQNSEARINRYFTFLTGYDFVKAYDIFRNKRKVNKIPVIDAQGMLLGDYSRWDDMLFVERNQGQFMQEKSVRKVLQTYEMVYVIEPVENLNMNYLRLIEYLKEFHIEFVVLRKEKLGEILSTNVICIFLNEDEKIGSLCLYGIEPRFYDVYGYDIREYDMVRNERCKARLTTYKNLLLQIMKETKLTNLKIEDPIEFEKKRSPNSYCKHLDDKATILFSELDKKGIKCFCFHNYEDERTEYGKNFINTMVERLGKIYQGEDNRWTKKVEKEAFYGELYRQEDYRKETAQNEIYYAETTFEYKRDIVGKYFNARDGRRVTCYQPKEYIGTIYLLGPCTIIGACVEDRYTIESFLQKKLLEEGYAYRVENCGSMIRSDSEIDNKLKEIGVFYENDIIIYHSAIGSTAGIENDSLERIFEKNQIPSTWVADGYAHCNHKANVMISDYILEMIKPYLRHQKKEAGYNRALHINFHNVMKEYIKDKYLFQFFSNFLVEKSSTVGAIIMSGNPFHKGHRYLIEQAKKYVELIIIFVIDDDSFMFSFEERYKMVVEGTKEINNILVVPNGDFIFSRNNIQEYYLQHYWITTALNAEYDLNVFADYIAEPLHITHRFVGADPQGRIKRTYYETMRRILPQKGISLVEIPRMMIEGEIVNSTQVHKYLANREYDKVFSLVPESTKCYLMEQLDLTDKDK